MLVQVGPSDFRDLVRRAADGGYRLNGVILKAVVRAALESSRRDELLDLATTLEPIQARRRVRRAILMLLAGNSEALRLGREWHGPTSASRHKVPVAQRC